MNFLVINLCKILIIIVLFLTQCFGIILNTIPPIPENKTVYYEPEIMVIQYSCYTDEPLPYELMMRWYVRSDSRLVYVEDIPEYYKYFELMLKMEEGLHNTYIFCAVIPRSEAYIRGPVNLLFKTNEVHLLLNTMLEEEEIDYSKSADKPEIIVQNEPNQLKNTNTTNTEIGFLRKYDFKRRLRGHSTWVLLGSNLASVFLVLSILSIVYYVNKRRALKDKPAIENVHFNREPEYAYIPIDVLPVYETKALAAENKKHNSILAPSLPERTTFTKFVDK